jgi:hypothetical protein
VPRGLASPAGAYAPGRLGWGPAARPIRRPPIQAYRPVYSIPLQPSNGQAIVSGSGSPALIQSASNTGSATTITVTLGTATGAGHCLIAYVAEQQGTTNPTVSGITLGGAADHWAVAVTAIANADVNTEIWSDRSCAGGQTAVAVSFNAGTGTNPGQVVYVEEWSGLTTAAPLDKTSGANGSSISPSSGTTAALTQANELVVGVIGASGGSTITLGGAPVPPWTNTAQINFTTNTALMAGHQVVSATAAQTYSGSINIVAAWGACVATFLASAATTPGVAQVTLGPAGLGNIWYPAQVTLSTTTGILAGFDSSVANLYLGSSPLATTLLGTVFGGNGIVAAALPNIQPGLYLIAQWTNATPADVASMNVSGVMDALA